MMGPERMAPVGQVAQPRVGVQALDCLAGPFPGCSFPEARRSSRWEEPATGPGRSPQPRLPPRSVHGQPVT